MEADLVKVPVREQTLLDLLDGYETFATIDLDHVDLVISGKYPADAATPQPRRWMLHRCAASTTPTTRPRTSRSGVHLGNWILWSNCSMRTGPTRRWRHPIPST
ncbi:MAG: hypothetical protein R2789_00540 [Microthrixaceae bacterium]